MNKAAQCAGAVYEEILNQEDRWDTNRAYWFGVMIGQSMGFSEEFCTPQSMIDDLKHDREIEYSSVRRRRLDKCIEALELHRDGMDWIEAMERVTGYYDRKEDE